MNIRKISLSDLQSFRALFHEHLAKIKIESNADSDRNMHVKNQISLILSELQRGVRALTAKDKDVFYIARKINQDFDRLEELINHQKITLANINAVACDISFPDDAFFL